MPYATRAEAGRILASSLTHLLGTDPLVLGLPRGGVPVAREVAVTLLGRLDVLVVRKLGLPWQPELAMGAIGEDGIRVLNDDVIARARVTRPTLESVEAEERRELDRRVRLLRGDAPPVPLTGRTVVIVDDGTATGATAVAACRVARARGAARLVVAMPVATREAAARLRGEADEVVCPLVPRWFDGVGGVYRDFHQLSDGEVRAALET